MAKTMKYMDLELNYTYIIHILKERICSATETVLKTLRELLLISESPSQGRKAVGTLTRFRQPTGLVEGFLFFGVYHE